MKPSKKILYSILSIIVIIFIFICIITISRTNFSESIIYLVKFHQNDGLNGRLYLKNISNLKLKEYESEDMQTYYKIPNGNYNVELYFIDHLDDSMHKYMMNYYFEPYGFYEITITKNNGFALKIIKKPGIFYYFHKLDDFIGNMIMTVVIIIAAIMGLLTGKAPF